MKAFLLILLFSQIVYGEDEFMTFSFINDSDEKRFYSLQKEVSCPLCEGSSIAGSNAPIASDIKNKIYTEILLGKSDEEILANLSFCRFDFDALILILKISFILPVIVR